MGFLSLFNRKRRTKINNFSSYKAVNLRTRKPFSPKQQRDPREKRGILQKLLKIFKILFVLGLILGGLYLILLTKLFEIQKVEVNGEEDTLEEQTALNTSLQEYLGKNLLFIKSTALEEELAKKYPYLKAIAVNKIPLHTLKITLETFTKVANVRMDLEDGSNKYFILNENGYIVGTEQTLESLPLIVMDAMGTSIDMQNGPFINQELIAKDTLDKIIGTKNDFEDKFDMQVLSIHYLKQAREVHLYTERFFYVWIDLTEDTETQFLKLKKALSVLNIYEASLEYIDLRISGQNGEKVIYKLQ